jgi:hypothetical protein
MALSEDHIQRAVDEALEPAWPHERHRALQRWRWATAGRITAGLATLFALGLALRLMFGMTLPWVFYGFMGALMTVLAFSQSEGREHLRPR